MISEKDYLKDYKTMNETEQKDYLSRVEKWNSQTFPELLALSECWEKVPVKDFDEGCRLVSAIVAARPFLSNIQRHEATRAIKKMNLYLEKVHKNSALAKKATRGPVGKERYRAIVPYEGEPDEEGTVHTIEYKEESVDNRRPKDFVMYKEKLPKELREKGEKEIPDLYLALSEYRHTLDMMEKNPIITDEAKKDMVSKVLSTEHEIRAFWAKVDSFMGGTPLEETDDDESAYINLKRPGDFTRSEIEAMTDAKQQEVCRKARIDGNKKYINRSDVKVTDEYKEQLELRIRELMDWDENLPKKTAEVATAAGVYIVGVNAETLSEVRAAKAETAGKEAAPAKEEPAKEEAPKKKIDPTESVTEAQIQKGGVR